MEEKQQHAKHYQDQIIIGGYNFVTTTEKVWPRMRPFYFAIYLTGNGTCFRITSQFCWGTSSSLDDAEDQPSTYPMQ